MSAALTATIVISLAAAGYSAYAQNEAADKAEQMANYNAEMQKRNNEMNYRIAEQNNEYQRKLIEINAQQQRNDAAMVDNQAVTNFEQAREQIRRTRQEKAQMLSRQRASYAAAGVLTQGSPVEVLAETAGLYELQAADALYQNDLQNKELAYRADVLRQGGDVEAYKQNLVNLDAYSAKVARDTGQAQTSLNRLSALNEVSGMRMAATGTLISAAAGATSTAYTGYQKSGTSRAATTGTYRAG